MMLKINGILTNVVIGGIFRKCDKLSKIHYTSIPVMNENGV